ncbi:MAG TPA: hypothetical protein PKE31_19730 [Pseudomonadota bacterium]|nr:hypothetical protein [Pseudomonadota bacterium]
MRAFARPLSILFALLFGLATQGFAETKPLPHPSLIPSANPLCDSTLVPCLDIDDLAAHAYAHFLVLPSTDLRGSGVTIPYGVSMGLFGRLAAGISSHTSVWSIGEERSYSQGPVRFSATLLLYPFFPLRVRPDIPATGEYGSYYVPPRGLRVGLTYDHEWRVGPFDGVNTLGIATDLGTVRLVGTKAIGPFELTASVGALVDTRKQYATGEIAAQLGLYLPGVPALKLSIDAVARGVPAAVQQDFLLGLGDNPIRPQGALGLGVSYRPNARVDFGVSVTKGFGGLAPVTVIVRFLLVSFGKSYDGQAMTSLTQLGTDAAVLGVQRVKEAVENLLHEAASDFPIDPKLDDQCYIRDDDGSIMGKFGTRTAGGGFCEQDGQRVPIGQMLYRDRNSDRLCREITENPTTKLHKLRDCVLWRKGNDWLPAYQTRLNNRCELRDENGEFLGKLGERSNDGTQCRYPVSRNNGGYGTQKDVQEQPVGGIFYTDKDRSTICENPNLTRCFLKPAGGRSSLKLTNIEHGAVGFGTGIDEKAEGATQLGQNLKKLVTGRVHFGPLKEQLVEDVTEAAQTIRDPDKLLEIGKRKFNNLRQGITNWNNKPTGDKFQDAGAFAGTVAIDAAIGAATGALGRTSGELAEGAEKLGKAGKRGKQVEEVTQAVHTAEHAENIHRLGPSTKHAGFRKNYADRSASEIRRGITSLEAQIAEHEAKIANPGKFIPNWSSLDPRQQQALLEKKWPADIARQKEQRDILKGLLGREP